MLFFEECKLRKVLVMFAVFRNLSLEGTSYWELGNRGLFAVQQNKAAVIVSS